MPMPPISRMTADGVNELTFAIVGYIALIGQISTNPTQVLVADGPHEPGLLSTTVFLVIPFEYPLAWYSL